MSTSEHDFDELEQLMALSLQKSGDLIPWNLEDVLDEDFSDVALPPALANVEAALARILAKDSPLENCQIIDFQKEVLLGSEIYAMAARSGAKLSDETRRKLKAQHERPNNQD